MRRPAWFVYGMTVFVAVLVWQVVQRPRAQDGPHPVVAPVSAALPMLAGYVPGPGVKVQEEIVGGGPVLLCGQRATLRIGLQAGEHIVDIATGRGPQFAFSQLLAGMRVGGVRRVDLGAPRDLAALGAGVDESVDAMTLSLLAAAPASAELFAPQTLWPEVIDTRVGTGPAVRCGDRVGAQMELYGSHGTLRTKMPITFIVGDGAWMLGIEQGVIGMRAGGTRTLVLAPAWQVRRHPVVGTSRIPDEPGLVVVKLSALSFPDEEAH